MKISRRSVVKTILPAAALATAFSARAEAADQPQMQAALSSLRAAKRHLDKATTDKGGHRARALELVNQAIDEVEKGIRYDRRN